MPVSSDKRICLSCKRERLARFFVGTKGQICSSCRPSKKGASTTRKCEKCERNRQLRFFSPQGRICSTCQRATRKRTSRAAHVEKNYGLSREDYDALFELQGKRCAICWGTRSSYDLDHDHKLEHLGAYANRGILCARCNRRLLPSALNDPEILERAAQYLREPPARAITGLHSSP
jgi:hypothetical protein